MDGIPQVDIRLGRPEPAITVGSAHRRHSRHRAQGVPTHPPDILVTTPESLFLLLGSTARESLLGVRTVIVDEVHAVTGTKRGAHLALSLARLDAQLGKPAQRIGLSVMVRPVEEVSTFLADEQPIKIVRSANRKSARLRVEVPVADVATLGEGTGEVSGSAAGPERRSSIRPDVEQRILALVGEHRATVVFANSRRPAEQLTARLNEPVAEPAGAGRLTRFPAEAIGESGIAFGAPPLVARAHHGSISREQATR